MNEIQLRLLLSRVQALSDENWHLLEPARRAMADHAWVGPSAGAFDAQMSANSRLVQAQLRTAVELLQQKLRTL